MCALARITNHMMGKTANTQDGGFVGAKAFHAFTHQQLQMLMGGLTRKLFPNLVSCDFPRNGMGTV